MTYNDYNDSGFKEGSDEARINLEEFSNKQHEVNAKVKKITTVVGIVFLLTVCFFAHRIITNVLAQGRIQDGIYEMKNGLRIINRPDGAASDCFDNAIISLNSAIKYDWYSSEAYYLIGISHYYKYFYKKTILFEKDSPGMSEDLGNMNIYLNKAIKCKSNYPEAHVYMGVYYCEKQKYDEALKEFDLGREYAEKVWKDRPKQKDKWLPFLESTIENLKNKNYNLANPPIPHEHFYYL